MQELRLGSPYPPLNLFLGDAKRETNKFNSGIGNGLSLCMCSLCFEKESVPTHAFGLGLRANRDRGGCHRRRIIRCRTNAGVEIDRFEEEIDNQSTLKIIE